MVVPFQHSESWHVLYAVLRLSHYSRRLRRCIADGEGESKVCVNATWRRWGYILPLVCACGCLRGGFNDSTQCRDRAGPSSTIRAAGRAQAEDLPPALRPFAAEADRTPPEQAVADMMVSRPTIIARLIIPPRLDDVYPEEPFERVIRMRKVAVPALREAIRKAEGHEWVPLTALRRIDREAFLAASLDVLAKEKPEAAAAWNALFALEEAGRHIPRKDMVRFLQQAAHDLFGSAVAEKRLRALGEWPPPRMPPEDVPPELRPLAAEAQRTPAEQAVADMMVATYRRGGIAFETFALPPKIETVFPLEPFCRVVDMGEAAVPALRESIRKTQGHECAPLEALRRIDREAFLAASLDVLANQKPDETAAWSALFALEEAGRDIPRQDVLRFLKWAAHSGEMSCSQRTAQKRLKALAERAPSTMQAHGHGASQ